MSDQPIVNGGASAEAAGTGAAGAGAAGVGAIDAELVQRTAAAARIRLTPDEVETIQARLRGMAPFFERLQRADTTGVEPVVNGLPAGAADGTVPLRPDVVQPSLPRETVLQNAAETEDGFFKVPRVIEE